MPSVAQALMQALFVAWQHPGTHQYFPVGRLVASPGADLPRYEFAYLRGVSNAVKHGFQTFMAFPDTGRVYRSDELFPFFENRLMSAGRPEYAEYLRNLGMNPDESDPMQVLIRSGGARATDSLEMFALPTYDPEGEGNPFKTHFLSHGLRYLNPFSLKRIESLKADERLFILADCQNPADASALALRTDDRSLVGYFPRYLISDTAELLQTCQVTEVFVERVNLAAPLQQRLLCRLEACWPPAFRPYCGTEYQPLPDDAVTIPCGQ